MSKPAVLEEALVQQAKGRNLTKRERKVIRDSQRSEESIKYREQFFPVPKSYHYGDIDHQRKLIEQEFVIMGKLLGESDTVTQNKINEASYSMVKKVFKFYGIKVPKEKESETTTIVE